MEWERLLFRFLFSLKGQRKLARVFCGELLVCFSAGFCLSPGRWLAGTEAVGAAPGLPGAAFGEGIALPLCVLCWH